MHARHRKRKNFIASLREGDQILTSHEEKAAAILEFYSNLLVLKATGTGQSTWIT
jgi:hypothetical protein